MEHVAIWKRAPIAFAIALLVVGAAAGFGVGYTVGDNGGKATSKASTTGTTTGKKKLTPAQVKRSRLLACMAKRGVKWPKTPGKAPDISKAPPGVDHAKYNTALVACYVGGLGGTAAKTTVPSASP